MTIALVEDAGVLRLEVTQVLGAGEAKEVRIVQSDNGLFAELAGLRAPISLEQAERLITAGALDHRAFP